MLFGFSNEKPALRRGVWRTGRFRQSCERTAELDFLVLARKTTAYLTQAPLLPSTENGSYIVQLLGGTALAGGYFGPSHSARAVRCSWYSRSSRAALGLVPR